MAAPTPPSSCPDSLFDSMQNDRLVSIYIADCDKPLLIQQSTICSASDAFKAAFTNDRFDEAIKGVLRVPEDDMEAWKVFIFWLVKGEVYAKATDAQLIKAWVLGDKYGVSQLQDDIMWLLFKKIDYEDDDMLEKMEEAFKLSNSGSVMRKFLAEQTALCLSESEGEYESEEWKKLLKDPGNCQDLLKAITEHKNEDLRGWFNQYDEDRKPMWMRWMAGEGPNNVESNCVWMKNGSSWFQL